MSRPRALTAAQQRYLVRALSLRQKLSNEALARRLGVCKSTVYVYMHKAHSRFYLKKKFRNLGLQEAA